jgi:hypothetical protein
MTGSGAIKASIGAAFVMVVALVWPALSPRVAEAPAGAQPFVWGRDSLWSALETSFATSRTAGCTDEHGVRSAADALDARLTKLRSGLVAASAIALDSLENGFFSLAPRIAVCGTLANDYVALQGRLRDVIKLQSTGWDLAERQSRDRLYRLLYGSRAAVCSEVASTAYREHGVTLWTGISTISAPGLRRWLASFGVRQFETQEPSDLEYDPQLSVVAEWRDAASLFDDHLDNAVTDVMLEGAERGDALKFAWYALPLARLLKGYSWVRERFGSVGPIPEGMAPAAALRNRSYNARHAVLKAALRVEVEQWTSERGYRPPYWALVSLAREAN